MNLHADCSYGAVRRLERVTQKTQMPCAAGATTFVRSFLAVPAASAGSF
jgi:hypothetical protein